MNIACCVFVLIYGPNNTCKQCSLPKSTRVYVINNLRQHLIFLTRILNKYLNNCVLDCFLRSQILERDVNVWSSVKLKCNWRSFTSTLFHSSGQRVQFSFEIGQVSMPLDKWSMIQILYVVSLIFVFACTNEDIEGGYNITFIKIKLLC